MTPIPQEQLDAAQLWMERQLASVLLLALADSGLLMSDVDKRLGRKPGYMKRFIARLAEGNTGIAKEAVMLATAMNSKLIFGASPLALNSDDEQ